MVTGAQPPNFKWFAIIVVVSHDTFCRSAYVTRAGHHAARNYLPRHPDARQTLLAVFSVIFPLLFSSLFFVFCVVLARYTSEPVLVFSVSNSCLFTYHILICSPVLSPPVQAADLTIGPPPISRLFVSVELGQFFFFATTTTFFCVHCSLPGRTRSGTGAMMSQTVKRENRRAAFYESC